MNLGGGQFANENTDRLQDQGQAIVDKASGVADVQRGQGERQQEIGLNRMNRLDDIGFVRESRMDDRADESKALGKDALDSSRDAVRMFNDKANKSRLEGLSYGNRAEGRGEDSRGRMNDAGSEALAMGLDLSGQGRVAQGNVLDEGLGAIRSRGDVYDQAQGPSIADAQRQLQTDDAFRRSIALAKSGRGMGGGAQAEQAALGEHFGMQATANQQAAVLAAQEHADWQRRRLQGAGLEANAYAAMGGLYGQQRGQDDAMKGLGMNLDFQGASQGEELGARYDAQGNDIRQAGWNREAGYTGMGEGARAGGWDDVQGFEGQAQGYSGMGLDAVKSFSGLGNQAMGTGFAGNAAMQGIGNNFESQGWSQQGNRESTGLDWQKAQADARLRAEELIAGQYRAMQESKDRQQQGWLNAALGLIGAV
jgi:hypothetical protein